MQIMNMHCVLMLTLYYIILLHSMKYCNNNTFGESEGLLLATRRRNCSWSNTRGWSTCVYKCMWVKYFLHYRCTSSSPFTGSTSCLNFSTTLTSPLQISLGTMKVLWSIHLLRYSLQHPIGWAMAASTLSKRKGFPAATTSDWALVRAVLNT